MFSLARQPISPQSDNECGDYVQWLNGIVLQSISESSYIILSLLWCIHMTHHVSYHMFSQCNYFTFCQILRTLNSSLLLFVLVKQVHCLHRLIWLVCHLWSCSWLCKAVDEDGVQYPIFVNCCGTQLNISFSVGSKFQRNNWLYRQFAISSAAYDANVANGGESTNT